MSERQTHYAAGPDYDAIRLADIQDVIDGADEIGQTSVTLDIEVLRWLVSEVKRLRKSEEKLMLFGEMLE